MKAKLGYTVRSTLAPGETVATLVPVIVERLAPTALETVVENCIDRGLIAGLKPTAAHGIADGVARQLAREFSLGRGIKFGSYFYGRPYLSGTVDANGRLTAGNGINVRLYKGEAFKLTREDFTLSFEGAGDAVKADHVMSDTREAGGNTRGTLVPGAHVVVQGRNLWAAGDTDKVTFAEVGGTAKVEVAAFLAQGDGLLKFTWPGGLAAGKAYAVTVARTDANGVTRTSNARVVTVRAAEPPSGPTFTKVTAPGHEDDPDWVNKVARDGKIVILGTGFTDEVTAEFSTDGMPETFNVTARTSTSITGQIAGGLEAGGTLAFELKDGAGDVIDTAAIDVVE